MFHFYLGIATDDVLSSVRDSFRFGVCAVSRDIFCTYSCLLVVVTFCEYIVNLWIGDIASTRVEFYWHDCRNYIGWKFGTNLNANG